MFLKFTTIGPQGRGTAYADANTIKVWNDGEIRDPADARKVRVVNVVGEGYGIVVAEDFEAVSKKILEARGETYTAPAPAGPSLIAKAN
jgi:hypothetical protein